jgi:hypothetical protein
MESKVIGYMCLHYGKEYLRESLLSVIDLCDKFVILYSEKPSFGYGSRVICPDTEDEMIKIALDVCGDKLIWHKHEFSNEGEHRNYIYRYTDDYDIILVVDGDEVFHTEQLKKGIEIVSKGVHRNYGVAGYVNLWRSFDYACYDGFLPIRLINLHNQHKDMSSIECTIWHFSCCQSKEIMDYKYEIHGHKDEIRPNWLRDIYYGWTPENNFLNLHPVANGIWNATPYDKEKMPSYLKEHINYNKEIV